MAAYRRVDDLRADCLTPGSAPGPTLDIEYGKAFTFYFLINRFSQSSILIGTRTYYFRLCGVHLQTQLTARTLQIHKKCVCRPKQNNTLHSADQHQEIIHHLHQTDVP